MTDERFEKVYMDDNYSKTFAAFRDQYAARGQKALAGRKVDKQPQPNATTIIYLKDDPSGDVRISGTGAFVDYYNRRKGNDSIGATRRAFEMALRKQEEKTPGVTSAPKTACNGADVLVQAFRPRVNFMQVIFAMMLVLSLVLLSVTSMLLEKTDAALLEARSELAELTVLADEQGAADVQAPTTQNEAIALSLQGEDTVVIHSVEEQSFSFATLLDALASLGK